MPVWSHIHEVLSAEVSVVGISIARLVLAAILGGAIGLERELKHRPAGLRTNMFICFGAALFTLLSDEIAHGHAGDHTRIAAAIIPGIGFIGAGSILHYRKDYVTGLTTAATIFVAAAVGMAAGGGLYLTATFATLVILLSLYLLGWVERRSNLKLMVYTYEVVGSAPDEVTRELNHVLEPQHIIPRNLQFAPTREHVRVQFELEGSRTVQEEILSGMRQSSILKNAVSLGTKESE